jgi:hypothetical protein
VHGQGIGLEEDKLDVLAAFDTHAVVRLMKTLERCIEQCPDANCRADQPLQGFALFDRKVVLVHPSASLEIFLSKKHLYYTAGWEWPSG